MEEIIAFYGESIIGRRSNNEDSYLYQQIDNETYLFLVADGMGGSEHGEVASRLVVDTFASHIKKTFQEPIQAAQLKSVLEFGFEKTQIAIKEEVEKDAEHLGMGTTLVVLLIQGVNYVWGNIGDSRLYQIDYNGIEQITRDHTYIEDILKDEGEGSISAENLSQYSHIITRSISGSSDKPDIYPEESSFLTLDSPKMFILCSDGLITDKSNRKNELEFYRTYLNVPDAETFAKSLIKNAFDDGSNDNITALCVSFGQSTLVRKKRKSKKLLLPISLFFILLIIGAVLFIRYSKPFHDKKLDTIKLPGKKSENTISSVQKPDSIKINNWQAFSPQDLALTKDSPINFTQFPDISLLEKYMVLIKDIKGNHLDSIFVVKENGTFLLNKFNKLKPSKYKIEIIAILKNRARFSGGEVPIKIIKL